MYLTTTFSLNRWERSSGSFVLFFFVSPFLVFFCLGLFRFFVFFLFFSSFFFLLSLSVGVIIDSSPPIHKTTV